MNIEPFNISVSSEVLDDLQQRLVNYRWPLDFDNDHWQYGTNGDYLKELVDYWIKDYDWRLQEEHINSFSHFRTEIEGMPIHFIHERGKGPRPIPIILNHGWPWTFWDFHKVIEPLTDPASHGGDPADAFDVILPSLPGYGFSSPLTTSGINYWRTADMWVTLMRDVLGYDKFAVQGGDWGSLIGAQLGHKYAQHLIGLHLGIMVPLDLFENGTPDESEFAEDERHKFDTNTNFFIQEDGYFKIQATKPQTVAYGLNDSPVGLCAWILEKRHSWGDCNGDVESRFSKDELITVMMLYWITETLGTSARYYYEAAHHLWKPSHDRQPVVEAPTGIAYFPKEVIQMPKNWAKRYYNLQRWTEIPSGGHFAPMEEPQALVKDIRAFFRELR
jgi:pimeloyl-ACP methyl ester carboxylesterase